MEGPHIPDLYRVPTQRLVTFIPAHSLWRTELRLPLPSFTNHNQFPCFNVWEFYQLRHPCSFHDARDPETTLSSLEISLISPPEHLLGKNVSLTGQISERSDFGLCGYITLQCHIMELSFPHSFSSGIYPQIHSSTLPNLPKSGLFSTCSVPHIFSYISG